MPPTTRGTTWHTWDTATASTPWGEGGERTPWDLLLAGCHCAHLSGHPRLVPFLPLRKESGSVHRSLTSRTAGDSVYLGSLRESTVDTRSSSDSKGLSHLKGGFKAMASTVWPGARTQTRFLSESPTFPCSCIRKTDSSFRWPQS